MIFLNCLVYVFNIIYINKIQCFNCFIYLKFFFYKKYSKQKIKCKKLNNKIKIKIISDKYEKKFNLILILT